jgi:hypothetical protein
MRLHANRSAALLPQPADLERAGAALVCIEVSWKTLVLLGIDEANQTGGQKIPRVDELMPRQHEHLNVVPDYPDELGISRRRDRLVDERTRPVAARPRLTHRKRIAFVAGTIICALAVGLVLTEGMLRLCGIRPWQHPNDPVRQKMYQPDPELGWTIKQDRFEIRAFAEGQPDILFTNWSDGRRATAAAEGPPGRPVIVTIGCSFTQGFAISDSETCAWRLQQRFPSVEVRNYGTGGYATYQSLLTLERALRNGLRPRLVLYGFIQEHEDRNVAPQGWLKHVAQNSRRASIGIPYCTIDGSDRLVRHAPEGILTLPLRESLATVAFAADNIMKLKTRSRYSQRRRVTELLLLEMQELCRTHGAELRVAMFQSSPKVRKEYTSFCREQGIEFVECDVPLTQEYRVLGDGHPNGEMNRLYAETIAESLGELIDQIGAEPCE